MSLDAGERTAKLQTREQVRFGKALIATGARVNILHHLEGARLDGIHYLRMLGNSDAIREEATGGGACRDRSAGATSAARSRRR